MIITNDQKLSNVISLLKAIPETFGDEKNPFALTIKSNIATLEAEEKELKKVIDEAIKKHALTDENGEIVTKEGVTELRAISDIEFVDADAFYNELDAELLKIYNKDVELKTIDTSKVYLHRSGEKITYENFITNSLCGEKVTLKLPPVQVGTTVDEEGNSTPQYKEQELSISIIDFLFEIGMIKK